MALCSAQRTHALVNLSIDNMSFDTDSVSLLITSLMKTAKPGQVAQTIIFKKYDKQELCPVFTLKRYLKVTENHRKAKNLLISFKTFKKVSTSTLAHWLKNILQLSGIDSDQIKAHSFRGASTSAAFMSGVTLNDIMQTANWKSANTFQKYYLRETKKENVHDIQVILLIQYYLLISEYHVITGVLALG